MARIDYRANFAQKLKDELERLITAIEHKIAKIAETDADVSPEIKAEFSGDVLRDNILLVVALGEAQYFWLCYWRDGHGGAYAYDEDDFPKLRDCNRYADAKEVAKTVGLSDSRFLYTEKVERRWIINTTYSKAAAKPIAYNLVQMHKQLNTSRSLGVVIPDENIDDIANIPADQRDALKKAISLKNTREHILRDWEEANKAFFKGLYKASTVLYGAALEGLLLGYLMSPKAHKRLRGKPLKGKSKGSGSVDIRLEDWRSRLLREGSDEVKLDVLIAYAKEEGNLQNYLAGQAKTIQLARNAIHLRKAINNSQTFDPFKRSTAELCRAAFNSIIDQFSN